jgi:class 3 adenylate cyclase/tetratricopeptide (TPR) repeat protein
MHQVSDDPTTPALHVSVPNSGIDPEESEFLRPYVPRLVVDWLRNTPDALHREVEASLVFVDISGFTALTERLARKGKVGAELMRDTLDGVFTALLDEAYDWGAGLLKWGGDALLLMFDGPEHPQRAARAAWEMQDTIDRVGRLHLSGGTIILRMSVGIGTGQYHFFMTGSVHRELLIAGPAMTETLAMEAIADAGEIGISPALIAKLQPTCIGPQKDSITLLGAPPEVERRRAPDVGDVRTLDIASCIPVAARAHVLLRKSEPEHRTITAAFIDMMDTDRLLEELGPEALGRGLDERMRCIQEAALRYEVPFYETDVGKASVKALLTAGAPSSTGHDEERMLRTLRDIMEQPGVVPMRIGVNTGKVFTGDFGPPYRRAYRVFGDAINTAARVMSKADAGQILSTEIVLNRSRTVFETTPIAPFAAKGKSEPVKASIVGPATGTKEAHHGGLALLGREEEFGVLLGAIERARAGHGAIVEVSGGPGTGKTRIIEEAIARSPDFRPISARCEEYESSTPYFPFRAIVRDVLGVESGADTDVVVAHLREAVERLDPKLAPWIPLLGILLGVDLPPTPETAALDARFLRDSLTEVALRFLAGSLSGSPTLFVIEDVQHVDEASRDLLLRLSQAAADLRQALIVTREGGDSVFPADDDAVQTVTIDLGPLSLPAMTAILEAATDDDPLRPHEIEELARRSGGNPLFLFQLLDTVRATGTIEALPDSIESLIAGEIDQLAPADRTILRYASVLGTTFDPGLLVECVRDQVEIDADIWTRLGELVLRQPNGELRFRSTLIRDAAYEGLPYRRRRALHSRVGDAIEATAGVSLDEEIGALALHYHEAQRWDKAWHFCRLAGDRAMAIYANVEATRFYDNALGAGRRQRSVTGAELAALYERSADARYRLGEFDAADHGYVAARRLLDKDPVRAAPLVVKQAMVATRTGAYRRALVRVQRALHTLEDLPGKDAAANRARLLVPIAAVKYFQNKRVESIEWCERAIKEAKRGGAKDALAEAYKVLDLAYLENGEIDKATHSEDALAIYEELGDLRNQALILNNQGLIAHDASRWDDSRALYSRGLAIAEQIGDRSLGALMKYNLSEILIDQGRYDEAEPLIREVIRLWRASGAEGDVAEGQRELARLLARRGEIEDARPLLDSARAYQAQTGKHGEVLRTDARIAELLLIAGEAADALAVLDGADHLAATTDGGSVLEPTLARLRGWAYLQAGRPDEAARAFDTAVALSRRREEALEEALALDGLVALGYRAGRRQPEVELARANLFARLGIIHAPPFATEAAAEG